MQATVTTTRPDKLLRKLNGLKKRMRTKIVRRAVNAGGNVVLQSARRLIRRRSGFSAKALGKKGRTKKDEYLVKIGARTGYETTVDGRLHQPFHVLHLIEKGTQPHVITTRRGASYMHPGAKPNPFLEPSLKSNRGQVNTAMASKIMEGIRQEAAK